MLWGGAKETLGLHQEAKSQGASRSRAKGESGTRIENVKEDQSLLFGCQPTVATEHPSRECFCGLSGVTKE